MYTPTKQQWQTVIDNFEKVLPRAQHLNHLDMEEGRVNENDHKCGTVHCVGGWYAIAVLDQNAELSYDDGAEAMAIHLGLPNRFFLEKWANQNPDIWGNYAGDMMFYLTIAYGGAQTLAEVVEYLKGVRDRSPENKTNTIE